MGFGQSVVRRVRVHRIIRRYICMQNENPMFQNLSIFIFPVRIKTLVTVRTWCMYLIIS